MHGRSLRSVGRPTKRQPGRHSQGVPQGRQGSHPDLNPGKPEAEKRFKEINAANDIISDPDKRKRYDAGEIDETGAERAPQRQYYREHAEADPHWRYSQSGATGGGGSSGFEFDDDITLRTLSRTWRRTQLLPHAAAGCATRSKWTFSMPSTARAKSVSMPDGKTLDIAIPAGISEGKTLRLKGQGRPGSDGAAGDAYVEIAVIPDPALQARRLRHPEHRPSFAWRGAERRKRARRHGGWRRRALTVPKRVKNGTKLRLRGKGVPRGKDAGRGDQLVTIKIVPPEGADDALAEFMAEWEKTHPQHPRGRSAP